MASQLTTKSGTYKIMCIIKLVYNISFQACDSLFFPQIKKMSLLSSSPAYISFFIISIRFSSLCHFISVFCSFLFFLDAALHLYQRVYLLVPPSVGRSVCNAFVKNTAMEDSECIKGFKKHISHWRCLRCVHAYLSEGGEMNQIERKLELDL